MRAGIVDNSVGKRGLLHDSGPYCFQNAAGMMATKEDRNAARRLARILYDKGPEEYGPKLVRLNQKDQAYILDLIDRNQSRKARQEILRLDEQRIRRNRERKQAKQKPYIIDKNVMRRRAVANIRAKVGDKPKYFHPHVIEYVEYMTEEELETAVNASTSEIEDLGRRRAYVQAPDLEIEINPFWYHLKGIQCRAIRKLISL
jgi:hypothetical protein